VHCGTGGTGGTGNPQLWQNPAAGTSAMQHFSQVGIF